MIWIGKEKTMNKLETELGNKFINNLKKQVTEHQERIKIFKVHGGQYQERDISDWIGCFRGKFVAIEFKVAPNEVEGRQLDFLIDIMDCEGISIIIDFVNTRPIEYSWGQEYSILNTSFNTKGKCHYCFNAVPDEITL
jgi:hypothetical protein